MRAIESALFMIGYDLPKADEAQGVNGKKKQQKLLQPIEEVSTFPLQSQAQGRQFRAEPSENEVTVPPL